VSQNIGVDQEIVRAAMKRISNVSELVESGRTELPPVANQCVAVPEVAARFQSAFELAIERVNLIATGTQRQLAGNAQNIWAAAEELNAVDADIASALAKTEAGALATEPPATPAGTPVAGPNANAIGGAPQPTTPAAPSVAPVFSVGPTVSDGTPTVGASEVR